MHEAAVVRGLYDALTRRDVPRLLGALHPEVEWQQADGNPYSRGPEPLRGRDAVMIHVVDRLSDDWEDFAAEPVRIHATGGTVVVEAVCRGRHVGTGRRLHMRACHVWRIDDGRVIAFREYVDTAQVRYAMAVRSRGGIGGWGGVGPAVGSGSDAA